MFFDIIIIGSGSAGLTLALSLSKDLKIALLSKGELTEGETIYAQGGIAAVIDKADNYEAHIQDTIKAGAHLGDPDVIRFVVTHGKAAIDWLVEQGVAFTQNTNNETTNENGNFHLTREGGHSQRRILHAKDATGQAIELGLAKHLQEHPNLEIFTEHTAIDLIKQDRKCTGVYVFDNLKNQIKTLNAKCIVLATGGASKVYLYTSNPDCSSGDGIAMAHRIGCTTANLEFNQFHPTCLYHPKAKSFLISEAVRGEGGILRLPNGQRFMSEFDERAELAPRDIVARAIDYVMKRYGLDYVYLDLTHKSKEFIVEHFPTIYQKCLEFNYDMAREPIPVVPAAHYTCGGVVTDLAGRTNITNLYAIGEVACTGLHGANRLASNSLLENIVFAREAAQDIMNSLSTIEMPQPSKPWDESRVTDSDEEIVVTHNWQELRRAMWDYVGIVRTNKRLARASNRINLLKKEIQEYYGHFRVTKNLLELRNLVIVADLMVEAALARKENIGLHYNLDNL